MNRELPPAVHGTKRRIILRMGPGAKMLLAIDPPFPVGRPVVCGERPDIIDFATALSEITNWPVVNEAGGLQ